MLSRRIITICEEQIKGSRSHTSFMLRLHGLRYFENPIEISLDCGVLLPIHEDFHEHWETHVKLVDRRRVPLERLEFLFCVQPHSYVECLESVIDELLPKAIDS